MSSELGDLYQEVIIDHSRHPQNFRQIDGATLVAEGVNPLCGDQLTVYLSLVGDQIDDIAFEGTGCAISVASASLMTAELKGKQVTEAMTKFGLVHSMLTEAPDTETAPPGLGKLAALAGVAAYPMRVKCATLAWHTLKSALEGRTTLVLSE